MSHAPPSNNALALDMVQPDRPNIDVKRARKRSTAASSVKPRPTLPRPVTFEAAEQLLLSRQTDRLLVAFENIREGLAMYDGDERIVMMNHRYAEMYQVPKDLQQPGTAFETLLNYWSAIGLLAPRESRQTRAIIERAQTGGSFRLHLLDGRVYEVNEQSLPGGGWVSTHEDITGRVAAEARVLYLAQHDALTGLLNRAAFHEHLGSLLQTSVARDNPKPFALLALDLNEFKPVNDLYGHAAGDQVLIEVAKRARAVFGEDAILARLGGDEFAIIHSDNEPQAMIELANRLVDAVRRPIMFGRVKIELSTSIGIAFHPEHGSEGGTLLKFADRALYCAKHDRHFPVVAYSPDLDAAETDRLDLIRRLPLALSNGEIELYFQPIVGSANGTCHTAEALLRWSHPTRGRISPEHIIAIAEEGRLINQLGDWILRRALETARTWPDSVAVAVNLSASQFDDPGFAKMVLRTLEITGVAAQRLELELTETILCSDDAVETINTLREAGIRFSLDDFGTGYASLSYLLRFPFDRVKIDRSFVTDVHQRRDRRLIVEAVAGLAIKLGLEIVAEGVEQEAERDVVSASGCHFIQGYLYARPMPTDALALFFQQQKI